MSEIEQLFKILGFANRARRLTLGMTATLNSLGRRKVKAVLLASDASDNAANKIAQAVKQAGVPVYACASKAAFGSLFNRKELGIIGIVDSSFAKSIGALLR